MDLASDSKPSFTFQSNDLNTLDNRQSSFTIDFELPLTHRNILALESIESVKSTSTLPYNRVPCRYIQNGIEVINNGYAVIDSTGGKYKLNIYSGSVNIFTLIEGKYIADLDWSDLNHEWSLAGMFSRVGADPDIVYPLAAFSKDTSLISNASAAIYAQQCLPALYCKTILKRIAASVGLEVSGDSFIEGDWFSRIIMPIGTERWETTGRQLYAVKTSDARTTGNSFYCNDDHSGNAVDRIGSFDIGDIYPEGGLSGVINPRGKIVLPNDYTAPDDITIRWRGVLRTNVIFSQYYYVYTVIKKNGTVIFTDVATVASGNQLRRTFDITLPAGRYAAGDEIECSAFTVINGVDLFWEAGATTEVILNTGSPMVYGTPLDVGYNIPKIKQSDFLKTMLQLCAGTYKIDSTTGTIDIIPFRNITANKSLNKDWTNKPYESEPVEVKFRLGKYAQKNYMKWAQDDARKDYGLGTIYVTNENIESETTLFTLPFAGSKLGDYLSGRYVPEVFVWDAAGEYIGCKPRLLYLEYTDFQIPTGIVIIDGVGGTTINFTAQPLTPFTHFSLDSSNSVNNHGLSFDNTLIKDFYSEIQEMLKEVKVISGKLRLQPEDVKDFDFSIPIYFQQFNAFFYINKIEGWESGETLCKFEGVRV